MYLKTLSSVKKMLIKDKTIFSRSILSITEVKILKAVLSLHGAVKHFLNISPMENHKIVSAEYQ